MNTADVITAFLNNEMSPEQEREFLLSVAASDSMRLGLKSHVMLDRIMNNQVQRASVPESVRSTIFAAMNLSMAEPASAPGNGSSAFARQPRFGSGLPGMISKLARPALVALVTLAGFGAGYFTGSETTAPTMSKPTAVSVPTTPRDIRPSAPSSTVSRTAPDESVASTVPANVPAAASALRSEEPRRVVRVATMATSDRRHEQSEAAAVQQPTSITLPALENMMPPELPPFDPGNVSSSSSVAAQQGRQTSIPHGAGSRPPVIEVEPAIIKTPSDTNTGKPRE